MAFIPSAMFVLELFELITGKRLTKGLSSKSRAARVEFL